MKKISEDVKEIIEKNESNDYSKILDKKDKLENIMALSEVRTNIINWYDFKKNCTILELNGNYGEITGFLCDKAKQVVTIEEDKEFASLIEKRYFDRDNLEIKVGYIENIEITEKFDYVVIIGIAEELEKYIQYAKKHLNDNGMILLAINNKFGIKSFLSCREEYKMVNNSNTAISKNDINNILEKENLKYKYYYPLPDYKLTNVIYTEKYTPDFENISRDITYKDGTVNFNEVQAYKELLKDSKENFKFFANSFLLEISKNEIKDNLIRFVSHTNMRKDEYRIKTIVGNEQVYKINANEKSKEHIENIKKNIDMLRKLKINTVDSYDKEKIISQYVENGETFDKVLLKTYKRSGIDGFINEINEYINFLKNKLQVVDNIEKNVFDKYEIEIQNEDEKEKIKNMTFVKNGLWDLIFQNCFYINSEYYFYDQEWFEENVPVEYIIYRAITYFNEIKRYISDEQILQKLNIDKDYIELFKQLDDKIQKNIRKEIIWKLHTKEEIQSKKYQRLKDENNALKQTITQLEEEVIKRNNEVQIMKSSISWKVTKPLRTIRGFGRK